MSESKTSSRNTYDVLAVVVNYNSKSFLGIEKKLLEGLAELSNTVRVRLILVDNHSSDGSLEMLKEHGRKIGLDMETVRLSKNFGFTRAVNIAWHYARKRWRFKYFMLLNNDLVIVPRNVIRLLKYLEIDGVAGVQGTIMQATNPHLVDNAGFVVDIFGLTYPICRGYSFCCAKPCHPSFLSGAFSVYRASIIDRLGQPFNNRVECYYDDKYLGLVLWSIGYKLLHVPFIVAYHLGSASYADRYKFKSPQWFKGIVLAELGPSFSLKSPIWWLVALYYGVISVALSILVTSNYVKSYVISLKEIKTFKQISTLTRNAFELIPKLRFIIKLNRIEKGVKFQ
jgi:GT2 family glycosyltransferase